MLPWTCVPAGFRLPEEQQRVWDELLSQQEQAIPSMQPDASATTASSLEEVSNNGTSHGMNDFYNQNGGPCNTCKFGNRILKWSFHDVY